MNNLVTVTCTRDKWNMILQAQSIDKFLNDNITHYVIIEDDQTSRQEWLDLLSPYYKKHQLILIDKQTNPQWYPKTRNLFDNMQGWQVQQILKLSVSTLIDSDFYMNIDSKDVFIKPCTLSSLCFEGNAESIPFLGEYINDGFKFWIHKVSDYTGKKIPKTFWTYQTPFVFKTKVSQQIVNEINLEDLFLQVLQYQSEYLLYRFYSNDTPALNHPVPIYHRFMSPEQLELLDEKYNIESIVIFTLHRHAFSEDNTLINKFLLSKGFDNKLIELVCKNTAYWD